LGRDKQQTSYDRELRYDFTSYRSCLGETRDDSPKRNTDFVVQHCLVSLGGEFGLGAVVGLGTICLVSLDDWHDEGLVPKALNGGVAAFFGNELENPEYGLCPELLSQAAPQA
jgi:hypothetical protein